MKKITAFCSIVLLVVAFAACEKSQDFMRDNPTPTGKGYYPVSTNGLVDMSTNKNIDKAKYGSGTTFKTELQYMSEDKIRIITLYHTINGARTKVDSFLYAPSYSAIKKLDTLLVPYTVPALPSKTPIKLEYEIKNENTLSVTRTATIEVL